jgi:hypothetical protein
MFFKKVTMTFALMVAAPAALPTVVRGQSPIETNDPVARVLERIGTVVERRASLAERVLDASKLLNESTAGRKQGERARAEAALKQAETIIAEVTPAQQSDLIDKLVSKIAAERAALNPAPPEKLQTLPTNGLTARRPTRNVVARYGDYQSTLYNWGESKVQRVINQTGLRDFDEMARRGLLPLETRNYVPAVLAAWSQFQ